MIVALFNFLQRITCIQGKTERFICAVGDVLHTVCAASPKIWRSMLPIVEFLLKEAVHVYQIYVILRE